MVRSPAIVLSLILLLSACSSSSTRGAYPQERFDSTETFSRSFEAPPEQTCEAARRTLLSQGYLIALAKGEEITARKRFQPGPEAHVEIEFHVVCAADGRARHNAIAFANAVQDRYTPRKVNNSASVGVGAFGSLSVPLMSSDDALVKVASETVSSAEFYERFFDLLGRNLSNAVPAGEAEPSSDGALPSPTPAKP